MTKPQFAAEPSMEDILASIRKMISEERMGSRPIPDQIARSPFGESVAEPLTAEAAPRAPEPQPLPTPERSVAPVERAAPSFSSLSDAIKAATPAVDRRRSLEEKIADMLDSRDVPSRASTPSDPLAVFGAHRPASALSTEPTPLGVIPRRASDLEPQAPEAPPTKTQSVTPQRSAPRPPEAPANGATRQPLAPTPKAVGPAEPNKSEIEKDDSQRIIAMPHRNGAASAGHAAGVGTGLNGTGPNGSGTNGSGVNGSSTNGAARGLRPFPNGSPSKGPMLRDADSARERKPETARNGSDALTAKAPDAGKPGDLGAWPKVSEVSLPVPAKPERDLKIARSEPADAAAASGARAEATRTEVKRTEAGRAEDTKTPPRAAGGDRPAGPGASTDALLDAVVAMVHKDPSTMSVFASGNAFINGVAANEPASKPGPNVPQKLDRSAAELLRPMLRQWLADNMPRIVEEALRSELMSSQPDSKDSKES